jgi:membrane-bound lytic murein transglycosylase A
MRRSFLLLIALILSSTILVGCHQKQAQVVLEPPKDYERQLPPGQLALRKITNPADIPDFTNGCFDVSNLSQAIDRSLNYMSKPSSKNFYPYGDITHAHAVASLKAFQQLIDSGQRGRELDQAIRDRFDVYMSVGCDDRGTVLYTGYYTPILDGSQTKSAVYQYPLYKAPNDLVKNDVGDVLGRRTDSGDIVPYPARAEIESSNMFAGNELVWLSDSFEAYIAHVQGSAKIRLPGGKIIGIGYAGNNGHEYKSVGKQLVTEGKISADRLSLVTMIEYFKAHSMMVRQYTDLNPRYVFFRNEEGDPRGSLNEPVTPFRTIATDKSIYPRACLAFLDTRMPRKIGQQVYTDPYKGFVLDQDTGGAIRAPGRCDVYMGIGDDAGKLAGTTYNEGKLYYLFLKAP